MGIHYISPKKYRQTEASNEVSFITYTPGKQCLSTSSPVYHFHYAYGLRCLHFIVHICTIGCNNNDDGLAALFIVYYYCYVFFPPPASSAKYVTKKPREKRRDDFYCLLTLGFVDLNGWAVKGAGLGGWGLNPLKVLLWSRRCCCTLVSSAYVS